MAVLCIEAGKPHTAHVAVTELLKTLSGRVLVCDPYYGEGMLSRLAALVGCDEVRVLTQTRDAREKTYIDRRLTEFCTEHPHVEFRRVSTRDIHDRYILSSDALMILGHGLKDIGGKQSFVMKIPTTLVPDIANQVTTAFNSMWVSATPLS